MVDLRTAPPPGTPPTPPPRRRSRGPFILLLVLVVVGVATVTFLVITAAKDAPRGGGLRLEEPPPKPDGSAVEEEVLAAWRGYREALDEVNRENPDPDEPLLAQYATGEALETVRAAATRNRDEGVVVAFPENSISEMWTESVSIDGDTATVRSCEVDDGLLLRAENGEVINDDVVTYLLGATLVREESRWKVSKVVTEAKWDGVAGCALEHRR